MRRQLLGVLVLGPVLVAAACSGGSGAAVAWPTVDQALLSGAQPAADSVILRLGDLPPGWESKGPADPNVLPLFTSADCQAIEDRDALGGKVSDMFTDTSSKSATGSFIQSSAVVYDSGELAATKWDAAWKHLSDCRDQFAKEARDELLGSDQESAKWKVQDVDATWEDLPDPSLGDASRAIRLNLALRGQGLTVRMGADLVAIRKGRLLGTLLYGGLGTSYQQRRDALLKTLADRLEQADLGLGR